MPGSKSLIDVFQAYPDTAKAIGSMHHEIMLRDSAFTKGERELMAAFVSVLNSCDYCSGIHGAAAETYGIEPGVLEALTGNIDDAPIDARLKPVMHFIAKLTVQPARMSSKDTEAMLAAGWDDAAVYDAVCVCAFYNFMNRYVDGTGLTAAPDALREMGRQIATHGAR